MKSRFHNYVLDNGIVSKNSHSVCYSYIAYLTAFFKTHFPTQYMVAAMTAEMDKPDQLKVYLNECKRMGIEVRPPSILSSQFGFKMIKEGVIAFGLQAVKNVGEAEVANVVALQGNLTDCKSIHEWMRLAPGSIQNKKKLEALIYAGAFDDITEEDDLTFEDQEIVDMLNLEREQLGVYVSSHPMQVLDIKDAAEPLRPNARGYVSATGIIVDLEKITTKTGKTMYKYNLERLNDTINVIVFPKAAEDLDISLLKEGVLVTVDGRLDKDENPNTEEVIYKLIHNDIKLADQGFRYEGLNPIIIDLHSLPDAETISVLCAKLDTIRGPSYVYLNIHEKNRTVTIKLNEPTVAGVEQRLRSILRDYILKEEKVTV